jgi:hypothetical protein
MFLNASMAERAKVVFGRYADSFGFGYISNQDPQILICNDLD